MIRIRSDDFSPYSTKVFDASGNDITRGIASINIKIDSEFPITADITYLVEGMDIKAQESFKYEHMDYLYIDSDKTYLKALTAVAVLALIVFMFWGKL